MKKILAGAIIIIALLVSWACEKSPESTSSTQPKKQSTATDQVLPHTITDAEVGKEAQCPVMGNKFKATQTTLSAEYRGKVYYFCCGGCPEAFKENPERFIKPEEK